VTHTFHLASGKPISLNVASAASDVSNKCREKRWECSNPFPLTCTNHGEDIAVRCGRWRTCPGCSVWKQWTLTQRFLAGIDSENVPADKVAMFVTLTFALSRAPDEDGAHNALRSLVGRLRYRDYLGAYGWVLQRQKNGTLHYHGIWHVRPFPPADKLAEWRGLIQKSGFDVQNRIEVASREHAWYCSRYISRRLAPLAPLRRAYGFSREFPKSEYEERRGLFVIGNPGTTLAAQPPTASNLAELAAHFGVEPEDACVWVPSFEVWG
jgi:hypothetical protein